MKIDGKMTPISQQVLSDEEALRNADSVNDIRLKIKLEGKGAHDRDMSAGLDHLGMV